MPERPALLGTGLFIEELIYSKLKKVKRSSPILSQNIGTSMPARALTSLGCTKFPSAPLKKLFVILIRLSRVFGQEDLKVSGFLSSRRSSNPRILSG
jgi:hypothetical protein